MYDSFMSVENDNDLYVTGMMLFFCKYINMYSSIFSVFTFKLGIVIYLDIVVY